MLKEITTFILQQSGMGDWERDVNFFAGHLPVKNKNGDDCPIRCVVLLENAGGATVPDLADRADKAIQIWNRNTSFFTAREDAYLFYDTLHATEGWTLPVVDAAYYAMEIIATNIPAPIGNPDEKGNYIFSTNYIWMIRAV